MMGFRLHDPLWLAALVPVLLALLLEARAKRRNVVSFSSLAELNDLPVTLAQRLKRLLPLLRITALLLIVISLARPQQGREEFRVRTEGIAIQLVIDRSGSMAALDFQGESDRINRLDAVKQVLERFVQGADELAGRPDDQIGLVVFGGYAESRCPLTLDHGALLRILEQVEIPGEGLSSQQRATAERFIEGEAATAIGDALALGVHRLSRTSHESKVLILLSDGENNAGVIHPDQAAELAAAEGIKVYTIGIGSTGMAPFPVEDFTGRVFLRRQAVVLDEVTLRRIADATGGEYFNARDTRALENVYQRIDELEKTETEGVIYTDYRELFELFLLPGVALLLLEILLASTRFRTLP